MSPVAVLFFAGGKCLNSHDKSFPVKFPPHSRLSSLDSAADPSLRHGVYLFRMNAHM
jgi:hypothetical protein